MALFSSLGLICVFALTACEPDTLLELELIGVFTGWNVYEGQENEYAFRLLYGRVVVPAAREVTD